MALPAVPPLKDTDQTHPSHGPLQPLAPDWLTPERLHCCSVFPYHSLSLSVFPSLFSVALRIKALLKDESRGPLQTKEERELDPASDGGEWWLELEGGKKEWKKRLDMWGENVADRTHFNKMVMTIVFLVRSAERYARKKWRRLCDLGIDSTAAELELQVPQSAATLLNYPSARTFFLVKMLQVHCDWSSFGKWYISFFLCYLPPARSAVVAGQWLC